MALCLASGQPWAFVQWAAMWCRTHNSSACRSVSMALMAKRLAHTRLSQDATIYGDAGLASLGQPVRSLWVGAGKLRR